MGAEGHSRSSELEMMNTKQAAVGQHVRPASSQELAPSGSTANAQGACPPPHG